MIRVYGAPNDHAIIVEGEIEGVFDVPAIGNDSAYLGFSDGTVLKIDLSYLDVYSISVEIEGESNTSLTHLEMAGQLQSATNWSQKFVSDTAELYGSFDWVMLAEDPSSILHRATSEPTSEPTSERGQG